MMRVKAVYFGANWRVWCALVIIGGAALLPSALSAQEVAPQTAPSEKAAPSTVVSAMDAAGLLSVLKAEGYEDAELFPREDDDDSTSILIRNEGLPTLILFRDCDEAVPDFCETLVLSTSWDRVTPISAEAVMQANSRYRYISVWRDEDGDPYAQWAILTGREGISSKVFLNALERYLSVVYDYWDEVFDGDPEEASEGGDKAGTNQ